MEMYGGPELGNGEPMTNQVSDEKNHEVEKVRRKISAKIMELLQCFSELEAAQADANYEVAFNDGVAWVKEEFSRVARSNATFEEEVMAKPASQLTDSEKLAQEALVTCINQNPGLRTSDILTRIMSLPIKPQPTEAMVKGMINRLKNNSKIENKSGRWYSTNAKARVHDYQVMRYLPEGGKYLGSDITR
jgi:hypothetical protein